MSAFHEFFPKISSAIRYVLHGAAGLMQLTPTRDLPYSDGYHFVREIRSTGHWEQDAQAPFDREAAAKHIMDVLRPLMITIVIIEGLFFLFNLQDILKRWFRYQEKPTIESVTKLVYGAFLLSLMVCTLAVSMPIFLLALSATYFLKDVILLCYYIHEKFNISKAHKAILNKRSTWGIFNYLTNAVMSSLLLTASILFLFSPVAMSFTVVVLFITAFCLGVIKFFALFVVPLSSSSIASIGAISDEDYVTLALTDEGILFADNLLPQERDNFFASKNTIDATLTTLSDLSINAEDSDNAASKIKFVASFKEAVTIADCKEDKTSQDVEQRIILFKNKIQAIRLEAGSKKDAWSGGSGISAFNRPLRTKFFSQLFAAIDDFGTDSLERKHRQLLSSEMAAEKPRVN